MENLILTNKQLVNIKRSLVEGMTIASGSKSSSTYYHSKQDQEAAIKNAVAKLYNNSKELPLILANQKGATGKFIQEVLLNEFMKTYLGGACNIINPIDWYDNGLSDKAILGALYNLNENGIPYVLRLFTSLKDYNVNNERARKITLGYIFGHPNIEFNSIKYRNKLSKILKHIYGVKQTSILLSIAEKYVFTNIFSSEKESKIVNDSIGRYFNGDINRALKLFLFIFKKGNSDWYDSMNFPLISEYFIATVDITNVSKIVKEVLIGMISNKNHPQYDQLWSTKIKREATKALIRKNTEVTSVNQQVRETKSNKKLGVQKSVDMAKVTDHLALYKTGYENGFNNEIKNAIDKLAEKNKINNFPYENIGIVLDISESMKGHKKESKNTPRAIADYTCKVLDKSSNNSTVIKTAKGNTDLATSFVSLIKNESDENQYDAIFFITDGYENQYDGLINEVINIYLTETNRYLPIFQISPIVGAEMEGNVRTISTEVVKMAVNSPSSLMGQINARLFEIDTKKWLQNQVKLLENSNVSRYKNKVEIEN